MLGAMIRSTPHIHTTFVDGKRSSAEMAQAAIDCGMASLGFSEHGRQPFDFTYCLSERTEAQYIAEVRALKALHADQIRIYLGIEMDAVGGAWREDYEYVIGSTHYLPIEDGHIAVDSTPEQVDELVRRGFSGDGLQMARAYYDRLADFVCDRRPDIIAHPDLVRKLNTGSRYFDEADPAYLSAAKQALERMLATGALLEVNTGAMSRGYLKTPYPDLPLLTFWRERGGRAIYGSDSHDAGTIGFGFDDALEWMKAAGYREAWALNPGDGDPFAEYAL